MYRHQMRAYVRGQRHSAGWYGPLGSGTLFAIALVLAGGYYLLRNLGALPASFNDGAFWSVLLILLGVALLVRIGISRG